MELGDTLTLIQTMTGLVGVLAILWGLAQMQQAGRRRDRESDVMTETLRESTERQVQTLSEVGRALERQGQALDRHGQALAELLRRSACISACI